MDQIFVARPRSES